MHLARRIAVALAGIALAGEAPLPFTAVRAASSGAGEAVPIVVVFAIDTSGSVRPTDLARAAGLAASILADLPRGTETALFTFDDQARVVVPLTSSPDSLVRALAG